MHEFSEQLEAMSVTEVLWAFRDALVALAPVLTRLDILGEDTQTYDDFDLVAETLFDVTVSGSLQWKYGLPSKPALPRYGFSDTSSADYIFVAVPGGSGRFVQFVSHRPFGEARFNAVQIVTDAGTTLVPTSAYVAFSFVSGDTSRAA
jgi:hypothetical protein